MSQIPSIGNSPTQNSSDKLTNLQGLQVDDFLSLMIAELQNQDPLDPLDNAQMLQQLSQIREIGATDKLTETLDAVLLGQNVASATSLIGKRVTALSKDDVPVNGIVERVSIVGGKPTVHVGEHEISLTNVRDISSEEEGGLGIADFRF